MKRMLEPVSIVLLLALMTVMGCSQPVRPPPCTTYYIPPGLSKQAQEKLCNSSEVTPINIEVNDVTGWQKARATAFAKDKQNLEQMRQRGLEFTLEEDEIGGVKTFWATTPNVTNEDTILIYTHGGAYIFGSGQTVLPEALQVGQAAGMKLLSIDYALAPEYPFPKALEETTRVYRGLLAKGFKPENIGWLGTSAGGGLALAALLDLKNAGVPLPAAVGLVSPWTDLTTSGDTYCTLDGDDPSLSLENLAVFAKVYYQEHDPSNPLISPVNGDYANFPPMFIQVGTKEVLLSDATRLARNARAAGVDVTLDVWEGMWHVWQEVYGLPEAAQATRELGEFFKQRLRH